MQPGLPSASPLSATCPRLVGVRMREIMAVLGLAKSLAPRSRAGRHLPALRHWLALAGVELLDDAVRPPLAAPTLTPP